MKQMKTVFTASEAREDFYSLIRQAGQSPVPIEIQLREEDPVVMIRKDELESWQETLDILTSPDEMKVLREGKKDGKVLTQEELLAQL